jgi:phosphoglycolate phosphatase
MLLAWSLWRYRGIKSGIMLISKWCSMRYQTIIWDWNGTLLDDRVLALSVANELLIEHDVQPLSLADYLHLFEFPVQTFYERAGVDFARHDFEDLSLKYCAAFESRLGECGLFPSVRSVLTGLRAPDRRQFLLSSTEQRILLQLVARFGLDDCFDEVRGLDDGFAHGKAQVGRALLDRHAIVRPGLDRSPVRCAAAGCRMCGRLGSG